jgi:hypothetical protein
MPCSRRRSTSHSSAYTNPGRTAGGVRVWRVQWCGSSAR